MLSPDQLASLGIDTLAKEVYADVLRSRYPNTHNLRPSYIANHKNGFCADTTPRMTSKLQTRLTALGLLGVQAVSELHISPGANRFPHRFTVIEDDSDPVHAVEDAIVIDLTYKQNLPSGLNSLPHALVGPRAEIIEFISRHTADPWRVDLYRSETCAVKTPAMPPSFFGWGQSAE